MNHPNAPSYSARLHGARVYARGFYELLHYRAVWTPPDRTWRRHSHLAGGWMHKQWPGLVLWLPEPNECVVLGRSKHLPELHVARDFGVFALGPGYRPASEAVWCLSTQAIGPAHPGYVT